MAPKLITSSENKETIVENKYDDGSTRIEQVLEYVAPEFKELIDTIAAGKLDPNANLGIGGTYGKGVTGFKGSVTHNPSTGYNTVEIDASFYGGGLSGKIVLNGKQVVSSEGFIGGQIIYGDNKQFLGVSKGESYNAKVGIFIDTEGVKAGAEFDFTMGVYLGEVNYNEKFEYTLYEFEKAKCFPAGTLITLADSTQKPIEDIRHGDIVLSHDKNGNLTPAIVDKLFTNTTDAFIRLTFTDGREDLIATPGHHFLTETGDYMEIGHMARVSRKNLLPHLTCIHSPYTRFRDPAAFAAA